MGRMKAVTTARRPKMHGRVLLSGPSGAGKTWTALGMAQVLAGGDLTRVLLLDTERESALTYADVFEGFNHLPWRPPFDPGELTSTLGEVSDATTDVVIVDTFSKFWRGQGGTLDIADGKFGGWKEARPIQEALVEGILAVPAHVILCVRSKMDYLVEDGGHTVSRLGMAPIQDENLAYEVNVCFDMDMQHRITVTKSRCTAVPVGRMYPAGLERKAAEDYAEWLAGGIPPANRDDVERLVTMMAEIVDAENRVRVKRLFVELFGMPHSLTAAQVPEAMAWLSEELGALDEDRAPVHPDEELPPPPKKAKKAAKKAPRPRKPAAKKAAPAAPQEAEKAEVGDTPSQPPEGAPRPAQTDSEETAVDDDSERCAGCNEDVPPDHENPPPGRRAAISPDGKIWHVDCAPADDDVDEAGETIGDRMAH